MKIEYTRLGDYELPNLTIKNNDIEDIGKYGRLKLEYLKKYNKTLYTTLLIENKLTEYLLSVNKECEEKFNTIMNSYKENDGRLSERNKELNQMEWVKLMNNYKNIAEETILKENIHI